MVEVAENSMREVDVVLCVIDATMHDLSKDDAIIERLESLSIPVILVINKVDAVAKDKILTMIDHYKEKHNFSMIIPLSALIN